MIGRLHITLTCFPAKKPKVMEYIGLTAKNFSSVTAIPALLFTNVTATQGNSSIIAADPANHPKNLVFISPFQ